LYVIQIPDILALLFPVYIECNRWWLWVFFSFWSK